MLSSRSPSCAPPARGLHAPPIRRSRHRVEEEGAADNAWTWKEGCERTRRCGGPRAAPPATPPLPSGRCRAVRPSARLPPPSLQTRDHGEGAARLRAALAHSAGPGAVPPSGANAALSLVRAEERTAGPPVRRPPGVGGAWAPRRADGGERGALPAVTSGPIRGALPWKPRFHSCGFPGATPSHSAFSSMGGGGGAGQRPPPAISADPVLAGPQFTFLSRGLACSPSGRGSPRPGTAPWLGVCAVRPA